MQHINRESLWQIILIAIDTPHWIVNQDENHSCEYFVNRLYCIVVDFPQALLVVAFGILDVNGQRTSFKLARGTPRTVTTQTRSVVKTRAISPASSNSGQYVSGNEGRYVRSGNEGQYVPNNDDKYDHVDVKYVGDKKLPKLQKSTYKIGKTAFALAKQAIITAKAIPFTTTPDYIPTEPPTAAPRLITTQPRFNNHQQSRLVTTQPFSPPLTTSRSPDQPQEWLIIRSKNEVNQDRYHSL